MAGSKGAASEMPMVKKLNLALDLISRMVYICLRD